MVYTQFSFWLLMIFSYEALAEFGGRSNSSQGTCLMQINPIKPGGSSHVVSSLHPAANVSKFRLQNTTRFANAYRPEREAVVIRTTTSPHSVPRWKHWAQIVRQPQFATSGHHVWLSVDLTVGNLTASCQHNWSHVPSAGNCLLQNIGALGPGACGNKEALFQTFPGLRKIFENFAGLPHVGVHVYSEKDISSAFPDLPSQSRDYTQMYLHPLGWGFGPQTLSMLWKRVGHNSDRSDRYDHIWALQDDTQFGGTVANSSAEFLQTMAFNSRFTSGVLVLADRFQRVTGGWRWTDFGSQSFLSSVPHLPDQPVSQPTNQTRNVLASLPSNQTSAQTSSFAELKTCQRLLAGERVQRLSASLMDTMDVWCGKLKRCCWGEMFVPSVALCAGLGVAPLIPSGRIIQGAGEAGVGYCKDATRLVNQWNASSPSKLQNLSVTNATQL